MLTTCEFPGRRMLRMLLIGVLVVTCVRVWFGTGTGLPRAVAQIPDSGLQRKQTLEEIKRTNQLLARILDTLQTQTLKVSMESADKPNNGAPAPRTGKPKR